MTLIFFLLTKNNSKKNIFGPRRFLSWATTTRTWKIHWPLRDLVFFGLLCVCVSMKEKWKRDGIKRLKHGTPWSMLRIVMRLFREALNLLCFFYKKKFEKGRKVKRKWNSINNSSRISFPADDEMGRRVRAAPNNEMRRHVLFFWLSTFSPTPFLPPFLPSFLPTSFEDLFFQYQIHFLFLFLP